MFVQAFTVLLPFVLQAAANPYQRQSVFKTRDDCPNGVHIIGVRGTLEKPGFGALQDVVDHLMSQLPGSDSMAVEYPASGITIGTDGEPIYNFFQYRASEAEGLAKFTAEVEDFTERCPETGIVVMGYSQASITNETPLTCEQTSSVLAIVQLGDPTNVRNLPWHAGNATKGGVFPRQNFGACGELGDFWQSYCDNDDFFCDRGRSVPVHLGYVERYRDEIVDFIVNKVKGSESSGFKYRIKNDGL
ncbi:hypothetical protein MMC11_003533 [Xylographa trunciseda]|nr:hypothetical protein [Xylographa trunciseda]